MHTRKILGPQKGFIFIEEGQYKNINQITTAKFKNPIDLVNIFGGSIFQLQTQVTEFENLRPQF